MEFKKEIFLLELSVWENDPEEAKWIETALVKTCSDLSETLTVEDALIQIRYESAKESL